MFPAIFWLGTAWANAQIVGQGVQVDVVNATNGNAFTLSSGAAYDITGPNLATNAGGGIIPQFVRSTNASAATAYTWDTEQFFAGTPQDEAVVIEGRAANRAVGGDWEYGISSFVVTDTPPQFAGNLQPTVTPRSGTPVTADRAITSGEAVPFYFEFDPATRLLTYSVTNGSTNVSFTVPTNAAFDSVVLRVNIAPASGASEITRSLIVSDLLLVTGAPTNTPSALHRAAFLTNTVDSLVAGVSVPASATAIGQRQFAYWENILSDTNYFRLSGSFQFDWTGTAPSGSQAAFQFKLVDTVALIPEPGAAVALAAAALVLAASRRHQPGARQR